MIKYKLREVKPRIFLLEFPNHYDLCMTFLRYQEFYESPSPKFRNKHFTIIDFMEWYSKDRAGVFTYPTDWAGFNIPSYVVDKVHNLSNDLKQALEVPLDYNKYDEVMLKVFEKCYKTLDNRLEENPGKFYLIGTDMGKTEVINHEVAHGFFYTIPEYKKEMLALVNNLKVSFREKFNKGLVKFGYTKQVFNDETQAFLSTGWHDHFPKLKCNDEPFRETFNKYFNSFK
jgi:hypothetical protein